MQLDREVAGRAAQLVELADGASGQLAGRQQGRGDGAGERRTDQGALHRGAVTVGVLLRLHVLASTVVAKLHQSGARLTHRSSNGGLTKC
jgi:hypothetical protein